MPVLLGEVPDDPVAMEDLDEQAPARAEDPPDLGQGARVLLVAEVAERGEEVERRVEALVRQRQVAVVGPHELRPPPVALAPPRLVEQRLRAVDADDAEPLRRERERVAAEPARDVEQVAARRAARALRRGEGLRLRLRVALGLEVGPQVELAEELVPRLGRAG